MSSKGTGNPVDLPELLFNIIRTFEAAVVLESNIVQCEDNSVSICDRTCINRPLGAKHNFSVWANIGEKNKVSPNFTLLCISSWLVVKKLLEPSPLV